eukprot:TRINITY_DN29760_c0_g1_i2.p1 TRINITY_DN29760_c0_g1~~TRINITY_DN29760_c0_g1_i2.p1  ORF type:complete len:294 (+),score=27.89 TRINITY_DN29760_c0_g1_i2:447-1328(+)
MMMCRDKYRGKRCYVTGHSLGGYIAEVVASWAGVDGAAFNSPGPWRIHPLRNMTGPARPRFEVHLTRDDPLAIALFPKPENAKHIAEPIWHAGDNHRICAPFMVEIEAMRGVRRSLVAVTQHPEEMIEQWEDILRKYPSPTSLDLSIRRAARFRLFDDEADAMSDSTSESSSSESTRDDGPLPEAYPRPTARKSPKVLKQTLAPPQHGRAQIPRPHQGYHESARTVVWDQGEAYRRPAVPNGAPHFTPRSPASLGQCSEVATASLVHTQHLVKPAFTASPNASPRLFAAGPGR